MTDWSRLTQFPHHPHGRPDLYGYRLAYIDRLAQMEGYFQRLKTARKLATAGPDRTRLRDFHVHTCLLELAALSFVALMLVDQRQQYGTGLEAVPLDADALVEPGKLRKAA